MKTAQEMRTVANTVIENLAAQAEKEIYKTIETILMPKIERRAKEGKTDLTIRGCALSPLLNYSAIEKVLAPLGYSVHDHGNTLIEIEW